MWRGQNRGHHEKREEALRERRMRVMEPMGCERTGRILEGRRVYVGLEMEIGRQPKISMYENAIKEG